MTSESHAEAFRAYSNYFEDLGALLGGRYGVAETLAEGVIEATTSHPGLASAQRRPLEGARQAAFDEGMRKGWGFLRRAQREVEDSDFFDSEANAYLPYFAYYATYHCGRAFAAASRQQIPRDHAALLRTLSAAATRGAFPYPWSAWCKGCPETLEVEFGDVSAGDVHVLSRPRYETSDERLAMFLRTTRGKQLGEYYAVQRTKAVKPGKTRRALSAEEKRRHAGRLPATTIFDLLYRIRKKVSYGDADVFVLGPGSEVEARRLAEGLVLVCDATVAMLEAASAIYAGPELLERAAEAYAERTESSLIARRHALWAQRASGRRSLVAAAW
ncbi:MAG: hypothetical protein QOI31_1721 [Solirubrobacterales bacterium]|jgi:hypothetical protein|nr:hypothetical protein [Solirubrobacterales bacterium]